MFSKINQAVFQLALIVTIVESATIDGKVKLLTFNFCQGSLPTLMKEFKMATIIDLLHLEAKTSKTTHLVPEWLRLVCKHINCQDKALIIKQCDVERLFCFPRGGVCRKFQTSSTTAHHQSSPNNQWINKAPSTGTVVSPHWFPNDRIM